MNCAACDWNNAAYLLLSRQQFQTSAQQEMSSDDTGAKCGLYGG